MTQTLIELLRRLLVLGCLFAGIHLLFDAAPVLAVVGIEDFAKRFTETPFFKPKNASLDDFVRRQTAGRHVQTDDPAWHALIQSLSQGRLNGALQELAAVHGSRHWVVHRHDLPELPAQPAADLLYVHVPQMQSWVRVAFLHPAEITGLQTRLLYPQRRLGLALLAVAVLFYLLIPSPRRRAGQLAYERRPAVVIPDWLGIVGGAFFFALYLLIHTANLPGQPIPVTADGWVLLLVAFLLMIGGFLALTAIGFHYATLYLRITPEALEVYRWFGQRTLPWGQMLHCTPYRSRRGGRIAMMLRLFAPGPAALGQGLLLAGNEEHGLEIRMRNGETLRIMANAFPGFEQIREALRQHAVPGADAPDPG